MLTLKAESREVTGNLETLRAAGKVPAVFYGSKEKNTTAIAVENGEFVKVFREAGESAVITLDTPAGKKGVLVHEVQVDPVTSKTIHIDFYVVDQTKEVEVAIESMLKPSVILDILDSFTLFATDKKNRRIKIIARYQQYEGTNLIVKRVKEGIIKQGLIWHFQGSGKSLLMVFTAQELRRSPELKSPTVLIIVDRIDLDTQITSTFNATTGIWQASGAIAHVNDLLADAQYTPALNYAGNFTIDVSINDTIAPAVTGTKNITVSAVNDPPSATNMKVHSSAWIGGS